MSPSLRTVLSDTPWRCPSLAQFFSYQPAMPPKKKRLGFTRKPYRTKSRLPRPQETYDGGTVLGCASGTSSSSRAPGSGVAGSEKWKWFEENYTVRGAFPSCGSSVPNGAGASRARSSPAFLGEGAHVGSWQENPCGPGIAGAAHSNALLRRPSEFTALLRTGSSC